MRHGEAEGRSSGSDVERALTSRGIADCHYLAQKLASDGASWDAIICSSTRRTQESAECMASAMVLPPELDIRNSLTDAGADSLLSTLRGLPNEIGSVLMVAHNPGVHVLVLMLAGAGGGRAMRRAARNFPPGSLARLIYDSETWDQLAPGSADLRCFFTPQDFD